MTSNPPGAGAVAAKRTGRRWGAAAFVAEALAAGAKRGAAKAPAAGAATSAAARPATMAVRIRDKAGSGFGELSTLSNGAIAKDKRALASMAGI